MLILTRRPGESLILELPTGERIKVTVLEVKGNPGHRVLARSGILRPEANLLPA